VTSGGNNFHENGDGTPSLNGGATILGRGTAISGAGTPFRLNLIKAYDTRNRYRWGFLGTVCGQWVTDL